MEDLSLDGISLDDIPDFPMPPIDNYSPDDYMGGDDEFPITLFDVGIELPEKVVMDTPAPEEKPQRKAQTRQKRAAPVLPESEFLRPMVAIPEALMDTVIGRLASRVAECLEFPEASVFMALLSSASSSVATAYAVQYKTRKTVALGMYTIIEQPPATQKSHILEIGERPYQIAIHEHNKAIKAKWREAKERKDDEPSGLKLAFTLTTDPTSASLDRNMSGRSEGRFVVSTAEQTALISLFPESGSFASTNELVNKGWAGEYVSGMRAGRDAYEGVAQGSITIIAQPGSARRVLQASDGSGMAERFIFLSEPSYLGHRLLEGNYPTREDKADYEKAHRACVKIYSSNILSYANSNDDTRVIYDPENLIQIKASNAGYEAIRKKRAKEEPYMGQLSASGDMVMLSWLGKYETHVLKIAGVLHVFECHGNGCKVPETIPDDLIYSSMDLVDALADHILQVLRDAGEAGSDAEEEAIISVLERPAPLRLILQRLRGRKPFRSMEGRGYNAITRRVDAMIKQGILVVDTEGRLKVV